MGEPMAALRLGWLVECLDGPPLRATLLKYTMLTLKVDSHPLMNRMQVLGN